MNQRTEVLKQDPGCAPVGLAHENEQDFEPSTQDLRANMYHLLLDSTQPMESVFVVGSTGKNNKYRGASKNGKVW